MTGPALDSAQRCGISNRPQAARTSVPTVRAENAPTVRFYATLGQKPETELALV